VERLGVLVGGEWRTSGRLGVLPDINPADTEEVVAVFPVMDAEEMGVAIEAAADALPNWRALNPVARGAILLRTAELLRTRSEEIARDLVREMGKTLGEARGEVARAADFFQYYGGLGRLPMGDHLPDGRQGVFTYTVREPIGVVVAITPWNDPILTPARKLAPALISGNTVVLKPASLTPLSAWHLARALHDAGIPRGVVNVVVGPASEAEKALLAHPVVAGITFTGSTQVGLEIVRQAATRNIRVQTEMGGKNALVVMGDAKLDLAVELAVAGAFGQAGQRCTATSRVIVEGCVLEQFRARLLERAKRIRVGPGLDPEAEMGPVVSEEQLSKVLAAVERGREEGAEVLWGGHRLAGGRYDRGYFVGPTILDRVAPEASVAQEEIFGPVLTLLPAKDLDEAIELVNGTRYGLSAGICTESLSTAHAFAARVEAGCVSINLPTVGWDVHIPFGGFKESGSAFKEHGLPGLQFYTRVKSVAMKVQ